MFQNPNNSIIQGILGRWVPFKDYNIYLDTANCVCFPMQYTGMPFSEFKDINFEPTNVNQDKVRLALSLMQGNTINYPRLSAYLVSLLSLFKLGNQYKAEAEQFEKFNQFVATYRPIESDMRSFLDEYKENNTNLIEELGSIIARDGDIFSDEDVIKKNLNIKIDKKVFVFPFLEQDKLFLGNVEDYKNIPQDYDYSGTHNKSWITIKGLPFLIAGYSDDEYSAVNRVVASQIGKLLGLNCEETFLSYFHGKCVNLIAFKACISLAENQMFEMYELNHLNYLYQNEQKKAFYFLIQNWFACSKLDRTIKEKFSENFIDKGGNVFISSLHKAMFLTPQQMPKNLLIPFEINKFNYKPVKDMIEKVKKLDLVDLAFGSISNNFVELHDIEAEKLNKPTFYQKKDSFESNWDNLIKSLAEFEKLSGV